MVTVTDTERGSGVTVTNVERLPRVEDTCEKHAGETSSSERDHIVRVNSIYGKQIPRILVNECEEAELDLTDVESLQELKSDTQC